MPFSRFYIEALQSNLVYCETHSNVKAQTVCIHQFENKLKLNGKKKLGFTDSQWSTGGHRRYRSAQMNWFISYIIEWISATARAFILGQTHINNPNRIHFGKYINSGIDCLWPAQCTALIVCVICGWCLKRVRSSFPSRREHINLQMQNMPPHTQPRMKIIFRILTQPTSMTSLRGKCRESSHHHHHMDRLRRRFMWIVVRFFRRHSHT